MLPSTVRDDFATGELQIMTYERWLRGRSERFQRQTLGPARFELWRTGRITVDRFVNEAGRELTLAELRGRVPELFREVGL